MLNVNLIPALQLAEYAHRVLPLKAENAFRKYDKRDVPYITHPLSVLFRLLDRDSYTVPHGQVCLLHDVLEDTALPHDRIANAFGPEVYDGVLRLTSYSKQTNSKARRAVRKQMDRDYLKEAPAWVQEIKLLDREDNLLDLEGAIQQESDFVRLYVEETRLLVNVIGSAAPDVANRVLHRCDLLSNELP